MNDRASASPASADAAPVRVQVLYADDVRELRQLMRHALTVAGFAITCVPDGADAWAEIQRHPAQYHVLITDHHMPQMSGLELVRRLRQSDFAGRIIVISSELGESTDLAYHELNVDALLKKPVKFTQLPDLIRRLTAARFQFGKLPICGTAHCSGTPVVPCLSPSRPPCPRPRSSSSC